MNIQELIQKPFHEVGYLLAQDKEILDDVDGTAGEVVFNFELAWEVFSTSEIIYSPFRLMHTHPQGLAMYSLTDITTLEAWAKAFAPNPVSMDIVTIGLDKQVAEELIIKHVMKTVRLETKEEWESRRTEDEESPKNRLIINVAQNIKIYEPRFDMYIEKPHLMDRDELLAHEILLRSYE